MHEYVKEWWESKVFKGHEKNEENLKKFEDHIVLMLEIWKSVMIKRWKQYFHTN